MSGPILYLTGTNTGVGKTTLATLLLQKRTGLAPLKPFCSGGREDAQRLHALQTTGLSLDQINPFHFQEPLTPLLAARHEERKIPLEEVLKCIDTVTARGLPLLIEGAGGLLSPLGEGYSLAEIIERRPGKVCIVATNALGVLNLILLTNRVLQTLATNQTVVLMNVERPDLASKENSALLRSLLPGVSVFEIPHLTDNSPIPSEIDSILYWWLQKSASR